MKHLSRIHCAVVIAGSLVGCGPSTRNTEPRGAPSAKDPELTVIFTQRVSSDEALVLLPQFTKKAEMRGCKVETQSGELDMVMATCGGYAIVMARHGSDVIVACNHETDSEECRELARQIVQSGEPQLIAEFSTNDPTLLPTFKLAMRKLGCGEVASSPNVVNMGCSVGLVSLAFDSRSQRHVLFCAPLNSANCVDPVIDALHLDRARSVTAR